MEGYLIRLINERQELAEKYSKLSTVVYNERPEYISPKDFDLLVDQHQIMGKYLSILDSRIERAKKGE